MSLFFCPYSRRGGGVKWEKDNVPLYELFFWRHPLLTYFFLNINFPNSCMIQESVLFCIQFVNRSAQYLYDFYGVGLKMGDSQYSRILLDKGLDNIPVLSMLVIFSCFVHFKIASWNEENLIDKHELARGIQHP